MRNSIVNTQRAVNCASARGISGRLAAALMGLIALVSGVECRAQTGTPPLTDLGVDLVAIKGGPRLLGAVIERKPDGTVLIAVQRTWLKAAHAAFFEQCAADEAADSRQRLVQLRDRLDEWIKRRADAEELLFFLKQESARVAKLLAKPDEPVPDAAPRFLLLEFPKDRIERVYVQPETRKQVALVAWREQLANVEGQSVNSLVHKLHKQRIGDLATERVDLSDQLPPRSQDDREWAGRIAIMEYAYRQRVDFQGTGDVIVRTDEAAARPDLAQLAAGILKSQLGDLLDLDPRGKTKAAQAKWWEGATKAAERAQVAGFRITRVDQDLAAKRVSVESRFVAQMPDRSWLTLWTTTEAADASKPRPELEKQIAKDPQLSEAFKLAKAAGLTLGEEQMQPALRAGAATMEAQQAADARFFEFRDRYLNHLDGPPLRIAP